MVQRSRPARALWIEIASVRAVMAAHTSRPARALWIEIPLEMVCNSTASVEAREGLVD